MEISEENESQNLFEYEDKRKLTKRFFSGNELDFKTFGYLPYFK